MNNTPRLDLKPEQPIKILAMASFGALLECYEFMICIFMSSTLIKVFYPGNQIAGVFSIFTLAFLSRPIGGIFWGHIGDRYGRQKVFSLTMLLLVVPTLLIAMFPVKMVSIMTSGIAFAILRFLQGFLVGGEFPGGVTFIAEVSKARNRGFFIALFMAALTCGTLLASLISLILNLYVNDANMLEWGWRLPFVLSTGLVIIAIYIRNQVYETSFFCDLRNRKAISNVPLVELVTNYGTLIIYGIFFACCSAVGLTAIYTFLPQLMKFNSVFTQQEILYLTTIGSLLLCLSMPLFGYLSDEYGRKITFTFGLIGTTLIWGLFIVAIYSSSFVLLALAMLFISFLFAGVNANYCVILSELFPTNIRYSGVAVCYTAAYSICGGLLPILYTYFIEFSRNLILPWICFIILSLISFIIVPKLKNFNQQNLLD